MGVHSLTCLDYNLCDVLCDGIGGLGSPDHALVIVVECGFELNGTRQERNIKNACILDSLARGFLNW